MTLPRYRFFLDMARAEDGAVFGVATTCAPDVALQVALGDQGEDDALQCQGGVAVVPGDFGFDDEGVPTLIEKYVKPGIVSWEFRPYVIHGPIDMAANLVVTLWRGREKLHDLNPGPIHEIARRWIAEYEKGRVAALADLKRALEEQPDD